MKILMIQTIYIKLIWSKLFKQYNTSIQLSLQEMHILLADKLIFLQVTIHINELSYLT